MHCIEYGHPHQRYTVHVDIITKFGSKFIQSHVSSVTFIRYQCNEQHAQLPPSCSVGQQQLNEALHRLRHTVKHTCGNTNNFALFSGPVKLSFNLGMGMLHTLRGSTNKCTKCIHFKCEIFILYGSLHIDLLVTWPSNIPS